MVNLKGAREREETTTAAAAAELGPKTFTNLESDTDDARGRTAGGTGEVASLGKRVQRN